MTRQVWIISRLQAGFSPTRIYWRGPSPIRWTEQPERAVQFVRDEDADVVLRLLDLPNGEVTPWDSRRQEAATPALADLPPPAGRFPHYAFPPPPPVSPFDPRDRSLYRDALARRQGKNLDGSPRRETVPTYPEAEEGEAD